MSRHSPIRATSTPDTMPTPGDPRKVVSLNANDPLPGRLTLPPERAAAEAAAAGELAQRMVPVAGRLVSLVRDEGHVYEITALLRSLERHKLEALAVVLAAMVPVDKTPRELLAWVTWDEHGNPLPPVFPAGDCPAPQPGTHAGFTWHAMRQTRAAANACPACGPAETAYQRGRKRDRRRGNALRIVAEEKP